MPEKQSDSYIPSEGPWTLGPEEVIRIKELSIYPEKVRNLAFKIFSYRQEDGVVGDELGDWLRAEYLVQRDIELNRLEKHIDTMSGITENRFRHAVLLGFAAFSALKPSDIDEATPSSATDLWLATTSLVCKKGLGVFQIPEINQPLGKIMAVLVRKFREQNGL